MHSVLTEFLLIGHEAMQVSCPLQWRVKSCLSWFNIYLVPIIFHPKLQLCSWSIDKWTILSDFREQHSHSVAALFSTIHPNECHLRRWKTFPTLFVYFFQPLFFVCTFYVIGFLGYAHGKILLILYLVLWAELLAHEPYEPNFGNYKCSKD